MNQLPGSEIRATAEQWAHTGWAIKKSPFQIFPNAQKVFGMQQHMACVKNAIRFCTAWWLMARINTRIQHLMETSQNNSLTFCEAACKSYDNKHFAFRLQIHLKK